jgi:hypothetical protein
MIHVAGPYVDGVQRCARCDDVLCDYRNAAWPDGQDPPEGFAEGAHVKIDKFDYLTQMTTTAEPPDCWRVF